MKRDAGPNTVEYEADDPNPAGLREEDGWVGLFTRAQAPGAIPNGSRVRRVGGSAGAGTPEGVEGVVLGSVRYLGGEGVPDKVFYFVEWDHRPRVAMGAAEERVALSSER